MKIKFAIFILTFFIARFSYSQEICNNGIDDNGNGLVDLNDPGCTCTPVLTTVPSLIPNPSFETMACCPSSYSQVNCAQGWVQATSATSDYMNTCGFVFGAATAAGLVPFPNGNGILGCIFAPTWQEYVGSCLTSPLVAGTPYSLQFNVASTPIDGFGDVCNGGVINYSAINLTIYGSTSCANLPATGTGCPGAPWTVLGTVNYTPAASWGVVTINFTPSANINAIILGSPCTLPSDYTYGPCYPYFYFDNMVLNTTSAFSNSVSQSGTMCGNNVLLTGSTTTGATYQWYHNGVAIVGQTGTTLNVSGLGLSAGPYEFVTTAGGTCSVASTTVTAQTPPVVTATSATTCAGGASASLTANGASTYTWNPGGVVSGTLTVSPASTTVYTVSGTDANGCVSAPVTATVTVNNLPPVTATSASVCAGGTATITAGGASTYTWNTGAQTASISVTPAATTVYTVTATGSTGCVSAITTTVTVYPTPTPTASSNSPICETQTLNLSAGGGVSYNWNGPNGFTSPSQNPFITNVTAAAGGTYVVTVTSVNNCTATATIPVTINTAPVITVSGSTVCTGATANLSASGGSGYAWTGPGGFVSAVQNPSFPSATTALNGTYSVTVTSAAGCVTTGTANISVNPPPVVTVTGSTVCAGATINLTSPAGGAAYSWTGPGGFVSAVQNPTITNATTAMSGTYSVTVTNSSGCSSGNSANVLVNALPVPTIGNNSPVCVNQTLNLTSGGGSSYSWSGPNGFSSLVQNPSVTGVTSAASGIYTVTVTDANSCVNTATITAVINSLPVVSASGTTVCLGATINLTSSGGVSYSWSGPAGYSSNTQNPSIPNSTLAMSGSYVVTVTDANGCVNANASQVLIHDLPVITVNSAAICLGQQTATLVASGAVNYAWTPTTGLSSSVGSHVLANPSATTSYTVTGTDANNCINTATLTVTVNPLPTLTVSPATTSGCAPVCVTFTNAVSTSAGNCSWNFGDGQTSQSCEPNHCFTGDGTFSAKCTLTDNNGCYGNAAASVIVYPVPVADFNATPQPATILDPHIQFTNASTGAVISSYTWTLGDTAHTVSNAQNPSFIYSAVGSYDVMLIVTSNHGCVDSTIKIVKIDDEFMIYVPNAFSPNGDGINETFFAKGEGIKEFKMWIFDRWGQLIYFTNDIYKGWDGRMHNKGEVLLEDVYVWKIECKTTRNESKMLRGHVSLIK
ncbi:MAG: PKD domain-containing protein [Bacteroidia bacterium]